jgi:hypothetical protein
VLRDAAAFAAYDVDADDAVQERGFAVVDVAQERDDGRPLDELGHIIFDLFEIGNQLILDADGLLELDVNAELGSDELRHVRVHHRIDGRHDAFSHEDFLNLHSLDASSLG